MLFFFVLVAALAVVPQFTFPNVDWATRGGPWLAVFLIVALVLIVAALQVDLKRREYDKRDENGNVLELKEQVPKAARSKAELFLFACAATVLLLVIVPILILAAIPAQTGTGPSGAAATQDVSLRSLLLASAIALGVLVVTLALWVTFLNQRREFRQLRIQYDFQYDGQDQNAGLIKSAKKLLRMNHIVLHDYYNLGLSHSRWALALGGICIIGGLGLLAWAVGKAFESGDDKLTGLVMTGVAGALTELIGLGVVALHRQSASQLEKLHGELSRANTGVYGFYLASRIDDKTKRENALVRMIELLLANSGDNKAIRDDDGQRAAKKKEESKAVNS